MYIYENVQLLMISSELTFEQYHQQLHEALLKFKCRGRHMPAAPRAVADDISQKSAP